MACHFYDVLPFRISFADAAIMRGRMTVYYISSGGRAGACCAPGAVLESAHDIGRFSTTKLAAGRLATA